MVQTSTFVILPKGQAGQGFGQNIGFYPLVEILSKGQSGQGLGQNTFFNWLVEKVSKGQAGQGVGQNTRDDWLVEIRSKGQAGQGFGQSVGVNLLVELPPMMCCEEPQHRERFTAMALSLSNGKVVSPLPVIEGLKHNLHMYFDVNGQRKPMKSIKKLYHLQLRWDIDNENLGSLRSAE